MSSTNSLSIVLPERNASNTCITDLLLSILPNLVFLLLRCAPVHLLPIPAFLKPVSQKLRHPLHLLRRMQIPHQSLKPGVSCDNFQCCCALPSSPVGIAASPVTAFSSSVSSSPEPYREEPKRGLPAFWGLLSFMHLDDLGIAVIHDKVQLPARRRHPQIYPKARRIFPSLLLLSVSLLL